MVASNAGDFASITFAPTAAGYAAAAVGPGQCAFADRGLRAGEPLLLQFQGSQAAALVAQARAGGTFAVHVSNNNRGALVISTVDALPPIVGNGGPSPIEPSGQTLPQQPGSAVTAVVATGVNVRRGPGGSFAVIGSLSPGLQVAVTTCDGFWCRLAAPFGSEVGWVSQQFLRFASQPPVANGPVGPLTPPSGQVAAVASASFAGSWATQTDKGYGYTMQLSQTGAIVTGRYVVDFTGAGGRINGAVAGNVLNFNWDQDGGFTGTGQFVLTANGRSFSGTYRSDPHAALTPDLLSGTWLGQRK